MSKKKAENKVKITALYCRLSVEDTKDVKDKRKKKQEDESNSISNQKQILLDYAKKNGYLHTEFFVDATDIIGLKQNPTNGRRFSPIFSFIGHFRYKTRKCYF